MCFALQTSAISYLYVASGEKARRAHEVPRLPSFNSRQTRRGISCVRLAFYPEAYIYCTAS
jgi:hypothetical protein